MERLTLRALVALALLLGALLRLWQINQYGVNSDEAVYLGQAAALAHDPVLSRFFPSFVLILYSSRSSPHSPSTF